MRLLLDVGNTAIKWTTCEAGTLQTGRRFIHREAALDERFSGAWGAIQPPDSVLIASVADAELGEKLAGWMRHQWDITPEFFSTSEQAGGVTNAYPVPGDLGVDRWAALIGARHHTREAVCIVDCGTAITVDLLAVDGVHQGGLILPGVTLMQEMLLQQTAGIHASGQPHPASLLAIGTEAGVQSGALYMAAATIDRLITDMAGQQAGRLDVIMTGGDAPRVQSLLISPARHDPDLVLKGLAVIDGE